MESISAGKARLSLRFSRRRGYPNPRRRPMQRLADDFWPSWSWRALAAIGLADCLWLALSPVSLDAESWITIAGLIGTAGTLRFAARRWPMSDRVRMLALGIGFMLVAWPALRVLNHLTMTTAMPLADTTLAAWDTQLGLSWLAYVRWADDYPLLLKWMEATYQGLTLYSLATFPILLWCFGVERAREFVLIFFVTAVSATLIGMMFPADAAMAHLRPDPAQFRHITPAFGTYHLVAMEALRSGLPHTLSLQELPGLVTFPSFHTAMGVVGIYCCRGKFPIFVAALIVNGSMIAATPIFGSHYLVDLIGGAALALVAARLVAAPATVFAARNAPSV